MSEIPPSTFVPCEVPLPGGVLVLAPLRRFGLAAPEAKRDGSALRRLWGYPEAFARLRRDWSSLDLGSDPYRLSPQQIMLSLETAVAAGRLGAAFFPWVITSRAVLSAAPAPPVPVATPASSTVLAMSHEERIGAMLKLVPKHLMDGALKEAFLQLITPAAIGGMVAAFVFLLAGHAVGYGEVADVALAAFAYTLAGLAGVEALYNMIVAVRDASWAHNEAELDAAADRFAVAFAVLGVAILSFFIARSASKRAGARAANRKAIAEAERQSKAPPAANRAEFEKYTDNLRRDMGRPSTTDPKLSNIMDDMYRPNAKVGSGSTADAVRFERATGQPTGGAWHEQKAMEAVTRLQKWLSANPTAKLGDRAAAENVLRDLQNALGGK